MSIPPPHYTRRSGVEPVEDCRDYLRTGRCKYGASCKYNHPPNVQSGGGMRIPINPSEPMFPIRPNEPVCQYFMKYGTCKFGQTCKFHHPPQGSLPGLTNGSGTVPMNVRHVSEKPSHMTLTSAGTDPSGSSAVMLQFLPQRPDEPDCIYFLKNGRCKYGATCRYHHPIGYHQRRVDESRLHQVPPQEQYRVQKVQYAGQPRPAYPQNHGIASEGPVTVLNLDTSPLPDGFQPVQIITNIDGTTSYGIPMTDHGSSTASVASSFDTASSSLEHLTAYGDGGSGLLYRAKRHGSGGSLSAFNESSSHTRVQVRPVLHNSASEGNIARSRAASYGSTSESTYYDAASRDNSFGSWRNEVSHMSDQPRRHPSTHYSGRQQRVSSSGNISGDFSTGGSRSQFRGRVPVASVGQPPRSGQRTGGSDEGFTMMTSALLNMLETPEEAAAGYDYEDPRLSRPTYPLSEHIDPAMLERLSLNAGRPDSGQPPHSVDLSQDNSWSPSLRPAPPDRSLEQDAMPAVQNHDSNAPTSNPPSSSSSDVGLYLP